MNSRVWKAAAAGCPGPVQLAWQGMATAHIAPKHVSSAQTDAKKGSNCWGRRCWRRVVRVH